MSSSPKSEGQVRGDGRMALERLLRMGKQGTENNGTSAPDQTEMISLLKKAIQDKLSQAQPTTKTENNTSTSSNNSYDEPSSALFSRLKQQVRRTTVPNISTPMLPGLTRDSPMKPPAHRQTRLEHNPKSLASDSPVKSLSQRKTLTGDSTPKLTGLPHDTPIEKSSFDPTTPQSGVGTLENFAEEVSGTAPISMKRKYTRRKSQAPTDITSQTTADTLGTTTEGSFAKQNIFDSSHSLKMDQVRVPDAGEAPQKRTYTRRATVHVSLTQECTEPPTGVSKRPYKRRTPLQDVQPMLPENSVAPSQDLYYDGASTESADEKMDSVPENIASKPKRKYVRRSTVNSTNVATPPVEPEVPRVKRKYIKRKYTASGVLNDPTTSQQSLTNRRVTESDGQSDEIIKNPIKRSYYRRRRRSTEAGSQIVSDVAPSVEPVLPQRMQRRRRNEPGVTSLRGQKMIQPASVVKRQYRRRLKNEAIAQEEVPEPPKNELRPSSRSLVSAVRNAAPRRSNVRQRNVHMQRGTRRTPTMRSTRAGTISAIGKQTTRRRLQPTVAQSRCSRVVTRTRQRQSIRDDAQPSVPLRRGRPPKDAGARAIGTQIRRVARQRNPVAKRRSRTVHKEIDDSPTTPLPPKRGRPSIVPTISEEEARRVLAQARSRRYALKRKARLEEEAQKKATENDILVSRGKPQSRGLPKPRLQELLQVEEPTTCPGSSSEIDIPIRRRRGRPTKIEVARMNALGIKPIRRVPRAKKMVTKQTTRRAPRVTRVPRGTRQGNERERVEEIIKTQIKNGKDAELIRNALLNQAAASVDKRSGAVPSRRRDRPGAPQSPDEPRRRAVRKPVKPKRKARLLGQTRATPQKPLRKYQTPLKKRFQVNHGESDVEPDEEILNVLGTINDMVRGAEKAKQQYEKKEVTETKDDPTLKAQKMLEKALKSFEDEELTEDDLVPRLTKLAGRCGGGKSLKMMSRRIALAIQNNLKKKQDKATNGRKRRLISNPALLNAPKAQPKPKLHQAAHSSPRVKKEVDTSAESNKAPVPTPYQQKLNINFSKLRKPEGNQRRGSLFATRSAGANSNSLSNFAHDNQES